MTLIQAVVLGLVQGASEFLPISSSAHLYLVPWLLRWPSHSLAFDVALHLGTLVAVTVAFWRDLVGLAARGLRDGLSTQEGRLGWAIVAGTVPAAVAGLLLEDVVETVLRSPLVMVFTLAVLGIVLWWADRVAPNRKGLDRVTFGDVLLVGAAQAIALVPGVSRSGITMTAGLLLGLNRETAARVSFLLSFPTILGAGLLKVADLDPAQMDLAFWAGVGTAGLVGYLVIRFFLDYLRRGSYAVFALYRVALAGVVLAVYLMGGR